MRGIGGYDMDASWAGWHDESYPVLTVTVLAQSSTPEPVTTYSYRVVTTLDDSSIPVGGTTTAHATVYTTTIVDGISQGEDGGVDVTSSVKFKKLF